ncbi:MAG TPA: hypothetical protein VMU66_03850, partial [Gaiellales bacterium]|nr:hypothetical protein [Gaiellales bacterium]
MLLAIWLAPVLAMGLLGSLGSLAAGNASLGMAVAAVPLGASLFFNPTLVQIPLARLFLLSYTYSG